MPFFEILTRCAMSGSRIESVRAFCVVAGVNEWQRPGSARDKPQ
jgi:hypothetical protein